MTRAGRREKEEPMLTRIRIEAEGATTGQVQEDIFAAYDALTTALFWPSIVPSVTLTDEVYEQTDPPSPDMPRWYKGRAIARFTNRDDSPFAVQAEQLRGRTSRLVQIESDADRAEGRIPPLPNASDPELINRG